MGYEKEQGLLREEALQAAAKRSGDRCAYDSAPLVTAEEKASGVCAHCAQTMAKDD